MERMTVTLANHLKALSFFFMTLPMLIGALFYFHTSWEADLVAILFYAVFVIPSFVIHLIYYFKNRNQEIEVYSDKLVFREKGKEMVYKVDELEKIILFKSASLKKRGFQFNAIELYHYAHILTKTGEKIIITCLITPDVEEVIRQLKGVPVEVRRNIFSIP
jgi:hypothetical protein